jgi:hypothetical protein
MSYQLLRLNAVLAALGSDTQRLRDKTFQLT